MKIAILTLFPEMFTGILTNSIVKRAIAKNVVEIEIVDIRKYTLDKHFRVDSPPVGGGAGLIMKCQPIVDALNSLENKATANKILLAPTGKIFNQDKTKKLVEINQDIVLICGHYEGIDERINDYVDETISLGDYILSGGEIGAMAITDAIVRLLDGAISSDSIVEESFENFLLEYPQYAEPHNFEGKLIPDILYSGNHTAIRKWRRKESLRRTKELRPDLFAKIKLTKEDISLLKEIDEGIEEPKWLKAAIEKGHKFIKK